MNFFNKIKDKFKKEDKDLDIYDKGLSKSRDNFVSKLINLTNRYHKITEDFFLELEEI
jgi:fused signal recognition particle receptor